jgi:hypothetical protein
MLPLIILVVPPSVAGGGYACWYLGQQTALSLFQSSKIRIDAGNGNGNGNGNTTRSSTTSTVPSQQSTGSYIAGLATLGGMYGLQSSQFHRLEDTPKPNSHTQTQMGHTKRTSAAEKSRTAYVPPHKQAQSHQFQPPKSMAEAFQRMGRPVLMRAGAGGIAFFCSGIVQTLVTTRKE